MIHKNAFEALDRTLKDVLKGGNHKNCEHLFGGKVIVFGGDFRQIIPVEQNGSRIDIVNASLSSSHIWSKCKVLRLTKNMRLTVGCQASDLEDTSGFTEWLLEHGEGKLGGDNDGNAIIEISDDLLIGDSFDPLSDLIDIKWSYLQVAPLNEVVKDINDRFLSLFPGEEVEYLSSDSINNSDSVGPGFDPALHSPDFLNGLNISGMPNHRLKNGLCNGTRLQVINLGRRFIEVKFPVAVCFAMTINKSQGQSLARVGIYLRAPVLTHGQLYASLSREKSRDDF
ncbi:uncharacterized protein LOC143612312 [Bidens hawaiensis]|uniref:uncharacterized protein LOC143612312 n=1 Tax=Bidens hawaiensis TaxID=980011 RepID=UPI00404B92EF